MIGKYSMSKVYAVVTPGCKAAYDHPLLYIFILPMVDMWHWKFYETIDLNYSLGHPVHFFADLEAAKNAAMSNYVEVGIVELGVDPQGQITSIDAVHEFCGMQKKFVQDRGTSFFSAVKVPDWRRSEPVEHRFTPGVLAEMQRQYALSDFGNTNTNLFQMA